MNSSDSRIGGQAGASAVTQRPAGAHPAGGLVVVGVDESDAAAAAAAWAADEAVRRHAVLFLVHGYVLPHNAGYPDYQSMPDDLQFEVRQQSQRLLDRTAELLSADRPGLVVDTRTVYERPAPALRAASRHALLTVVGSGQTTRVPGVLLGSVALAVASANPAPVAVIHPGYPGRASGPVVVGVDGSKVSDAAVEFAFDEASLRRTELVAVHAWNDLVLGGRLQTPLVDTQVLRQEERALLSERLSGWRQRYPDVVVNPVLMQRNPTAALLEYAPAAQLMVVGSHGRGGFAGMLMGSTSQALITHARCPVIVARV